MLNPSIEYLERVSNECPLLHPELSYRHLYGDLTYPTLGLEARIKKLIEGGVPSDTFFLRDLKVLLILEQIILPNFKDRDVIKIASIGCSKGQEVYSLILRHWGQRQRMQIDGFDINPKNIETAIKGEYNLRSQKYFDSEITAFEKLERLRLEADNEVYRIIGKNYLGDKRIAFCKAARKTANFYVLNILKEHLPNEYDIVFALNLLYHFSEKGREVALRKVNAGMKKGAWLMCESVFPKIYDDMLSYERSMEDISALGFEKQRTKNFEGLPPYYRKDFSQVYRKVKSL